MILVILLFGFFAFEEACLGTIADSGVSDEIPYEQLVRELNSKVHQQQRQWVQNTSIDPFEKLQIHLSLGFIQTVNTLQIADRSISRLEDGFQLGAGIDLFSKEWIAEGILKNFGQSTQNESRLALREFDLRLAYLQEAPEHRMKLRLTNGLGARYLRYNSLWSKVNTYQTTPIYVVGVGFIIPMGSHFELDFEFQGHMSLISDTIDRQGLGIVIRLDNIF